MTKKQYELFAKGVKSVKPKTPEGIEGWISAIKEAVILFRENNPRFETQRFLTACGITVGEQNTYFGTI